MKQRNSRIQAASQQYQQTNESKCIQGKRRRTTTAIHIISQERMKNEEEEETKRSSCQTSNRHTNISQNDIQQTSSPKLAWFCSFFDGVVYIFLYFCCNSFFQNVCAHQTKFNAIKSCKCQNTLFALLYTHILFGLHLLPIPIISVIFCFG